MSSHHDDSPYNVHTDHDPDIMDDFLSDLPSWADEPDEDHDPTPVEQWEVTTPREVYFLDEDWDCDPEGY